MSEEQKAPHVVNIRLLRIQTDAALDVLSRRNTGKDELADCAKAFLVYLLTLRGQKHARMDDEGSL